MAVYKSLRREIPELPWMCVAQSRVADLVRAPRQDFELADAVARPRSSTNPEALFQASGKLQANFTVAPRK
jgi:hypothetical protein